MYSIIKKLLFSLVPKSIIYQNEAWLRNINYQLNYKGEKFQCNVCEAHLKTFIEHPYGKLCPKCGSLPRTRLLDYILSQLDFKGKKLLHFSPQKGLQKKLKHHLNNNYYDSDYLGKNTTYNFDIQNIKLPDNSIDILICYHVLEHVPYDLKAMQELFRVLKPNGKGFLQVPFKKGPTIEDIHEKDPKVRLQKFGQEDHLRWYNQSDFCEKLEHTGFKVTPIKAIQLVESIAKLGLNKNEVVIKVEKL